MEVEKLKAEIVALVTNFQGVKETELVTRLMRFVSQCGSMVAFDVIFNMISDSIDELIEDSKLVAIEYYLPNMLYRRKRFLLPCGTTM